MGVLIICTLQELISR